MDKQSGLVDVQRVYSWFEAATHMTWLCPRPWKHQNSNCYCSVRRKKPAWKGVQLRNLHDNQSFADRECSWQRQRVWESFMWRQFPHCCISLIPSGAWTRDLHTSVRAALLRIDVRVQLLQLLLEYHRLIIISQRFSLTSVSQKPSPGLQRHT